MPIIRDIVTTAVEQKRDIRFWLDISRVVLSPYLYGMTESGDTIVAGVTADGRSVSVLRSDMVGIEMIERRGHPLTGLDRRNFKRTWASAKAS